MKKRGFFIGPGAPSLMLAVVVVSMSVLGLLALMSARSDARLAQRTCDFTAAQYEALAASEQTLAELDAILVRCGKQAGSEEEYLAAVEAALPEGMTLDGRTIIWEEAMPEGHALRCAVEILGREGPRVQRRESLFISHDASFE